MQSSKAPKKIRKAFKSKKQLIKHILDADSDLEEYVLEIPDKIIPISPQTYFEGLWYGDVIQQMLGVKQPTRKLYVLIEANWYYTQLDSESRYELGQLARVDKRMHEVNQFAQILGSSRFFVEIESFTLKISHPLFKNHFDKLVDTLNHFKILTEIIIIYPEDDTGGLVQKENWTTKLKVRPILRTHLDL